VRECSSDATDHIKDQEPLWPPVIFKDRTEHPQREHIKENVVPATVEEEVSNKLVRPEKGGLNVMQREQFDQPSVKGIS
jgi:hypothetical protein